MNMFWSPDAKTAIADATRAYLKAHAPGVVAEIEVEAVKGDFARVGVKASSGGATPARAFLAKRGGRWAVVLFGTGFAPGDYERHGLPPAVRV